MERNTANTPLKPYSETRHNARKQVQQVRLSTRHSWEALEKKFTCLVLTFHTGMR